MADPMAIAMARYRQRQRLVSAATARAMRLWRGVDRGQIRASWAAVLPELVTLVTVAQTSAATGADEYADRVLDAQGIDADPPGRVQPRALSGIASDGRPLLSLLSEPAIITLAGITQGLPAPVALRSGGFALERMMKTELADAGRVADGIAVATRPRVGYVRLLSPPSCPRCAVLAGRWYKWNRGFRRHPRCDCVHIPAAEDTSTDLRTDPAAYFRSLSTAEQDRIFTQAGAQAIRDGADISRVVNARRGMTTASVGGRRVRQTTEGTTRRGFARPGRLMPEQIYIDANGNRAEAIRLLRRFGYIT